MFESIKVVPPQLDNRPFEFMRTANKWQRDGCCLFPSITNGNGTHYLTKRRSVQHYGSGNSSAVHKHKQTHWTRFSTHLSVRGLYAQYKMAAVRCFFYSLGKLSEKCWAAGISFFPTWIRCWVVFVYFVTLCSMVLFSDCDFSCVYTDLKSASAYLTVIL